jgi:hypothetical protein
MGKTNANRVPCNWKKGKEKYFHWGGGGIASSSKYTPLMIHVHPIYVYGIHVYVGGQLPIPCYPYNPALFQPLGDCRLSLNSFCFNIR